MKVFELISILQKMNATADVAVVDEEQDNCYEIIECRVCEDNCSVDKDKYIDIVIR